MKAEYECVKVDFERRLVDPNMTSLNPKPDPKPACSLQSKYDKCASTIFDLEEEIRRLKNMHKGEPPRKVEAPKTVTRVETMIMPLQTPVFLVDKKGNVVACSKGAEEVMACEITGRNMAMELVDPISSTGLKSALQKAHAGAQENSPIKVMFLSGRGTRLTFLINVFSGMNGNAEVKI